MNKLDFGSIMEKDCWWEDYDEDLRCPFCQEGVKLFDALSKTQQDFVARKFCDANDWAQDEEEPQDWMDRAMQYAGDVGVSGWYENNLEEFRNLEEEEFNCEECGGEEGGSMFEVMWNTAFSVNASVRNREEARRIAWGNGFCLIDHNGQDYLLMGSCGQDNTWQIHYTRWLLQGKTLDFDDARDCLSNWSAHVFLHDGEQKKEFLGYLVDRLLDLDVAVSRVTWGVEDALNVLEYPTPREKELAGRPEKYYTVEMARVEKFSVVVPARSLHEALSRAKKETGAHAVGAPKLGGEV